MSCGPNREKNIMLHRLLSVLALSALMLAAAAPAAAQCAMCRETASFQRAKAIEALNAGILVLGVPPIALLSGIGFVAFKRRNITRADIERDQIA